MVSTSTVSCIACYYVRDIKCLRNRLIFSYKNHMSLLKQKSIQKFALDLSRDFIEPIENYSFLAHQYRFVLGVEIFPEIKGSCPIIFPSLLIIVYNVLNSHWRNQVAKRICWRGCPRWASRSFQAHQSKQILKIY